MDIFQEKFSCWFVNEKIETRMYDERNWTDRKTWVREVEKSKEQQINFYAKKRDKQVRWNFSIDSNL